jgi:serine protease Do
MRKYFSNHIILLFLMLVALNMWFFTGCAKENQETQPPPGELTLPAGSPIIEAEEPEQTATDLSMGIVRVAKKNIPAVVHIEVTERQEVQNPFLPFENNPLFRYFFDLPDTQKEFKREIKGLGTGMIVDEQGHILTNNHVVGGASEIKVLLSSEKEYTAKIVGTDPKTDLAVIQIEADERLPYVSFGDSDRVEVGEWVIAIGHPRGLDQTVTQGIISAKHRKGITDPSSYQDFLQTDAAINPGNSGGPLLNLQGEVIGVNAAIASESGGFEGIGFAIPSNMALHISHALMEHGKVDRGWLGVSIQEITPDLAKSFGLDRPKGALIADVVKEGPAEKAGIKRGDVIISFNGKDIPDASTLRNEVASTAIGKTVTLSVWRKEKKEDVAVKIGNLNDAVKILSASLKDRLGAEFAAVGSREVEKYQLPSQAGVVITWIDSNGLLGKAGFEVGDILLEINGRPIEGMEEFVNLITSVPPRQQIRVLALDHRTGNTGYVQMAMR